MDKHHDPVFERWCKCRKILFFLTFTIGFFFSDKISAQEQTSVTLSVTNKDLRTILNMVEETTVYRFTYKDVTLPLQENITIKANHQDIETFLRRLLEPAELTYQRSRNVFSLIPKVQVSPMPDKRHITGMVTDANGEPVIGATVKVKRTNEGTVTNSDGYFELAVPRNAALIISYIGCETQEVKVGEKTVFNIRLVDSTKSLDEVVVVGYGTMKKVNLTGAISTTDAQALANRPITQASQALQGIVGVYVNQASGQPGLDGATIRVRGQGTLNNNDPLVLVDGIEYELNAINPNDIENISVLKDAASSAIYGSRAANGVVLVTTKKGKAGSSRIEYNNYLGVQRATYLPDFIYDPIFFMEMRNQAQKNEGKLTVDYPQTTIDEYREGMKTDPYVYPNNNWLDIMYNDAFTMDHTLRFSGAREKYDYSLSLGYGTQDGVLRGTDSQRYTIGLTTSMNVTNTLKVGLNIHGLYRIINQPVAGVANLVEMTYKAQAFHPTYLKDGRYADTWVRTPGHNIYRHPLALADEGENLTKRMRILTNLHAEWRLPGNILYNINVGLTKQDEIQTLFAPDVFEYQVKTLAPLRITFDGVNTRRVRKGDRNDFNQTILNTLSWEKVFGGVHDIKLLVGYSYENDYGSNFYGQTEGLLGNDLYELDAGANNPTVGGTSSRSVLMSYFGRANYNYKERYLFEANFRYDGSSHFAKGNRWGLFPSFSAGWRISEEAFMKNIKWINNLKLRASWGQLGNERIGQFRYVDMISLGQNYPFNGTVNSGVAVTSYNDPHITWETSTMTNIGLDASLWDRALDFTFEWFRKRTSDILRSVTIPQQVGSLAGPIQNIGTVDNNGYELGVKYRNAFRSLKYELYGNVTYVKNKIIDLRGQTSYNGKRILKEGYSIDSYYLLHAIGIFQSQEEIDNSPYQTAATKPGYLKFEDANKDGKITENDRVIRGGVIPKYTYGFGFNLTYGNLELTTLFQGVQGINTYGDKIGATPLWFGCGLPRQWTTDSWTPERGATAKLPILTTYEGALNENFRPNDFWLRDASYLRLKNIQLTYIVPNNWIKHTSIKSLKIFVNGQNLLTFSPMKDFDPEKNIIGENFYAFPSVKTVTGGINVTF